MARAGCPPTLRSLTEPSSPRPPHPPPENLPSSDSSAGGGPGVAPSLGRRVPRPSPTPGPALPRLCPRPQSWSGRTHTITSPCLTSVLVGPPPPASACMSWRARVSCTPSRTYPPTHPRAHSAVCSSSEAGLEDRPPPDCDHHICSQGQTGSLGPINPPGGASVAAGIDNYPNPQRERGLLPWGGSPGG